MKAYIYKIVNNIDDEIYVGSTRTSLSKRLYRHKDSAKKYPDRNNLYRFVTQYGCDCCRIVLIHEFTFTNKQEQIKKEQEYIDLLKPKMNKHNAFGQKCEHNKLRWNCKECGGSQICEHNRIRNICKDCRGSRICQHNKQKHVCKKCGGSQICEHNKIKQRCKECGGSQICEHNKRKSQCKECNEFTCEICNKQLCNKESLLSHIFTHFRAIEM